MKGIRRAESDRLYRRALQVMVGGVSSPVRSFGSVGGRPLFISRGKGSAVWDVDGNRFTDYVLSWGPLIVGHSNPAVRRPVLEAIKKGTSFGAPSVPELELAEKIHTSTPGVDAVRFVNSGTEATMSAIRLARAYTRRSRVVKFEGCYHGHADLFLTKAGSSLAGLDSTGVPAQVVSDTVSLPFNDVGAVERAFSAHGSEIACAIVEPVAGNMGVVPPARGFLEALRRLCTDNGSLLVFDEVITGFRVGPQSAQGLLRVKPDLTCFGKVIGGGFPVGAYGGRRDIMRLIAPEGSVFQAGTLSGNPVAMEAGLATLRLLDARAYSRLERLSKALAGSLADAAKSASFQVTLNRVASMVGLFFGAGPVRDFQDVMRTKHRLYGAFHRAMIGRGQYLPPSPFETVFLSTAHTEHDIERTASAARVAFKECGAV